MKRLLYFGAEWCASCKALKPIVEKEAPEMGYEVEFIDAGTDDGAFMANDYNVRSLPTIVVIGEDGIEEKRAVGNTAWEDVR